MKFATLKNQTRDGCLVLVSRDLSRCAPVPDIAPTLQAALDHWDACQPALQAAYEQLNAGSLAGSRPFDPAACHSPLPRAYQWADGSAYLNHVQLVRKARNSQVPDSFFTDPLMYQGGSDSFIGPRDPIAVASEDWGIDMEAEIAVVTADVPMGASPQQAGAAIRLLMLVNDVSLRGLIPGELAKGFGFFQSKPASAFSPVALTPDELGEHWRDGKVHLPLLVDLNGQPFGRPNAGRDMTFSFPQLIAHAARTRQLAAGSIVGSGTVSNQQGGLHGSSIRHGGVGYCCIAEVRMYETIETGAPSTPFMRFGDQVRIRMAGPQGEDLFGVIEQTVVPYPGA
ncbi:fumarylacetoacetate hydrolase family protein [Castellaniella hirudinis]|uniref:fumarylacetoacetate hydrolase family protein n=1 Tax=Castellaniella hirudinis TaxID=1144617 RepID=UPI0039C0DDA5